MKRTARLAVAASIALAPMSFAGVAHADILPCGPTDMACLSQYQAYWQNCYNQYNPAANHANSEAYTRCIDSFPLNPGWWCRGLTPVGKWLANTPPSKTPRTPRNNSGDNHDFLVYSARIHCNTTRLGDSKNVIDRRVRQIVES
jgi:hypothetical protein